MPRSLRCIALALILTFIATGCGPSLSEVLDSWKGEKIDEYIAKNGPPDGVVDLPNGHKSYMYLSMHEATYLDGPYSDPIVETTTKICKITLETDAKGRIVYWRYQGNGYR